MPLRTFEFIDVRDWCRPAESPEQLLKLPRTWWPLLASCRAPAARPDWYLSREIEEKLFLSRVSSNIGLPLDRDAAASGSVLAHLGPAIVKDSSLLILVRDNLALAEGYGDRRWADFQLRSWPQAHNLYRSVVGVNGPNWQMGVKAYDLDERGLLHLDRPCLYLSVRQDDRNLYHWIFETLPRLVCLEAIPELQQFPLLVRDPLTELQLAFLRWMGFEQEVIVTGGRSVLAADLFFASIPSPPALHRPLLEWLQHRITTGLPNASCSTRRRLFISRQDARNGRQVVNEDEVAEALLPLGFERLIMSRCSPLEQIQAFQQAEKVILPHGAAGAHLLFMPKKSSIIELHSPNQINNVYFAAAKTRGIPYGSLTGTSVGVGNNYLVDPQSLLRLLALTERHHH
ncbi:glycosyltransferase family 61 protein [Azospirillum picis]|uniref:Glycosyltransferase 61 catalytic domain-containing protein n=1 Tax=Azospirillum picis TaxID=488438 RepID=A0ABU0MUD7_9PROT|nr:glycosyltransferase family 61 protein [Azospirillum picis]MBP2303082.1 hypothetical protein [Azospirillum picis]MDQ0536804.1 hypothetical protein [Azospirillum picis]